MKFSVVLATCMEGLLYPVPFVDKDTFVKVAILAEEKGYHSIWGNDHISTQKYVQEEHALPPKYFDPLVTLAALAPQTNKLRLGIAVVVIPLRNPVVLSKQIATLDYLCSGRLEVAVGIGAYREEFEAMNPQAAGAHRGEILDEGIQSLLTLFGDRHSTFNGNFYNFNGVETYPKPVQDPFPLYVGGNSKKNIFRVAKWARGWMPAVLSPKELQQGVSILYEEADKLGRESVEFEIAPQYAVSLGKSKEEAISRFEKSHLFRHLTSLEKTTLKDQVGDLITRNLVGTPDQVIEKIQDLDQAGMTHCAALLFPANSVDELLEQIEEFAELVIQEYVGP